MLGLQSVFGDVDVLLASRLSRRIVATSIRVLLVSAAFVSKTIPTASLMRNDLLNTARRAY